MPVSSRLARKMPSIRPTVGKFCTPEKPIALQLVEEHVHEAERIGAVDAGEHRRVLHDRQHLARHLHHDLVGVAVGHQPGERAAARHAVAAGIVDDDEVDAAGLLALGRQPRAGAAADDRLAARHHGAESVHQGCAFERAWLTSPPCARSRAPAMHCAECVEHGGDERGIVDVRRHAHDCRVAVCRTVCSSARNSAASAAGSWNGWPGASSADTPPSGIRKRTGASIG